MVFAYMFHFLLTRLFSACCLGDGAFRILNMLDLIEF